MKRHPVSTRTPRPSCSEQSTAYRHCATLRGFSYSRVDVPSDWARPWSSSAAARPSSAYGMPNRPARRRSALRAWAERRCLKMACTGRTRDPLRDYAGGDLHGARLSLDTRRRARHAVSYRGVRTPGRVDAPRTGNLRTVGARPVVAGNAAPRRDTRRPARWIRRCAFRESPDADDASLHAAANAVSYTHLRAHETP